MIIENLDGIMKLQLLRLGIGFKQGRSVRIRVFQYAAPAEFLQDLFPLRSVHISEVGLSVLRIDFMLT